MERDRSTRQPAGYGRPRSEPGKVVAGGGPGADYRDGAIFAFFVAARVLDEFYDRHLCVVAATGTDLDDAGVAAGPSLVPRSDLVEQLGDHL